MARIFVRRRRHAGPRTGRPRFGVVAVEGGDLHFFRPSLRRRELEQIAQVADAELIYLSDSQDESPLKSPQE
ncbi:MAG: hypothetical protein PVH62_08025 [Anaerolineae bacterium]